MLLKIPHILKKAKPRKTFRNNNLYNKPASIRGSSYQMPTKIYGTIRKAAPPSTNPYARAAFLAITRLPFRSTPFGINGVYLICKRYGPSIKWPWHYRELIFMAELRSLATGLGGWWFKLSISIIRGVERGDGPLLKRGFNSNLMCRLHNPLEKRIILHEIPPYDALH